MKQNDEFTAIERRRWRVWVEGKDRGLTDDEIAEILQCSRSTITRLKRKAKRNGAYQDWVNSIIDWSQEELRELHLFVKESNPIKAYEQMGRIIERSLTRRIERKTDASIDARVRNTPVFDLSVLNEDEYFTFTTLIAKLIDRGMGTEGS